MRAKSSPVTRPMQPTIACLGLAAVAAYAIAAAQAQPPGPPVAADLCIVCHPWQAEAHLASAHALAARNPVFAAAVLAEPDPDGCYSCHAPKPVLLTGLRQATEARGEDRDGGIGCTTCHTDGVDAQVGPLANAESLFHACVEDAAMHSDPAICALCHGPRNPLYDQLTAYQASKYPGQAVSCQSCHMPPLEGPSSYTTRNTPKPLASHTFRGSADDAFMRDAIRLTIEAEGGTATARAVSEGVGHLLPGSAGPSVILRLAALDSQRREVAIVEAVASWDGAGEDGRVPPGQSLRCELLIPRDSATLRAALLYRDARGEREREIAGAVRQLGQPRTGGGGA